MELKNAKIHAEVVDGDRADVEIDGTGGTLIALAVNILQVMAKDEEFKASELAGLIKKLLEETEKKEEQA